MRELEDALEVQREDAVPGRGRERVVGDAPVAAGVVDEDVKAACAGLEFRGECGDVVLLVEVGGDEVCFSFAEGVKLGARRGAGRGVAGEYPYFLAKVAQR